MIDSLIRLGVTGSKLDRGALRTDLEPLLQKYRAGADIEAGLSPLLGDVMAVVRKHNLVLPGNLSLLFKTMASGEGTILRLDPAFRLVPAVTPYARRLLLRSNSPRAWAKRVEMSAPDVAWLATDGPRLLRRLLGDLESGPLKVDVQPTGFEPVLHCLERIGNRLVLGMLVSALIVALGVSASAYRPGSSIAALDMLVTGGFIVVPVLGGALAWRHVPRLARNPQGGNDRRPTVAGRRERRHPPVAGTAASLAWRQMRSNAAAGTMASTTHPIAVPGSLCSSAVTAAKSALMMSMASTTRTA